MVEDKWPFFREMYNSFGIAFSRRFLFGAPERKHT